MDGSKRGALQPKAVSFIRATNAKKPNNLRLKKPAERLSRHESIGAIEDLVQCGICLEKLKEPRMLPCQHTFCLPCLHSLLTANRILLNLQQSPKKSISIKCPVCQKRVDLEKGVDSVNDLPKNLYIDSILKLVEGNISPIEPKAPNNRCAKCMTFLQENQQKSCQHCMQIFCNVCWNDHLSELESNVTILVKQVEESKDKLDHKLENFESRCEQLVESIKEATLDRIEMIQQEQEMVLLDVKAMLKEKKTSYASICARIEELKNTLAATSFENNPSKVFSFMSLHQETSRLLSSVSHYGEAHVIFDPESFRLEQDTEGIYHDAEDFDFGLNSPNSIERYESVIEHYKSKSFVPKLVWNRCPRPANVGIPPWDNRLLYITATDTHTVLILNRDDRKLEGRLTSNEMLYPQGIAFSKIHQEIYVSDKWKHCIHVFSKNGNYERDILTKGNGLGKVRCPDGIAMGPNEELIICDSGNDRIIIINPQTGDHISTIGIVNNKTTLNMPTGVAVSGDKIVVADTGNHRIKVFSLDGKLLREFGSLGREKGQFRSAEVVAIDPSGFILVGDGGNARVQIFKPDGGLVKIFGGGEGTDGFGWVSGIFITGEMDIITSDSKKRCLRIF